MGRYITSQSIPNAIDFRRATLDLSVSCIKYLDQEHHRLELKRSVLEERMLAGTYRLHFYCVSTWLHVIEQYLVPLGHDAVSPNLTDALDVFFDNRINSSFISDSEEGDRPRNWTHFGLNDEHPKLSQMLHHVAIFQSRCSTLEYRLKERK